MKKHCFDFLQSSLSVVVTGCCVLFSVSYAQTTEDFAAIIKAPQTTILSSQVDGVVEEIHIREGDSFKRDDILLTFDCTMQKAKLDKAKAQYQFTSQNRKSVMELAKLNSASEMQVVQTKSEHSKAIADLTAAKHQVSQCSVLAPYDGSVLQSWVNTHENVDAKGKILEIINNNDLVAEFLAPSDMLTALPAGKELLLKVNETRQSYTVVIDRIVPRVDAVSQTIKVLAKIESVHSDLWSGMSGWAVLPVNE